VPIVAGTIVRAALGMIDHRPHCACPGDAAPHAAYVAQ
jgi:hypothetical protein